MDLDVAKNVDQFTLWLENNQSLLTQYVVNIVAALLVFVLGIVVARFFSNAVSRLMAIKGVDNTINRFLAAILRYMILVFAVVAALGCLGVPTTSVIAVLGAAGFAVALALQNSLSNFSAGVLIVVFRPFRIGEFVQLGSISGTVDDVQILTTTLRSGDNKTVIVPNSKIIANEIINFSRQSERRVDITVSVSYEADIDQVKSVLEAVIAADQRILREKGVTVRLNEMSALSLNFVVRVWANNTDFWAVYFDLMENIKKTLDANHIKMPLSQMDILRSSTNSS